MKKNLLILAGLLTFAVAGCDQAEGLGHQHSFNEAYTFNETMHWQESSCEHTEYTKNLGEHDLNEDGYCATCGALIINNTLMPKSVGEGNYPYILKAYDANGEIMFENTYENGGKTMITKSGNIDNENYHFVTEFNDLGLECKTFSYREGQEPTSNHTIDYDAEGKILKEYNSLDLTKQQIIYTYDNQGRLTKKSYQSGDPLVETDNEVTTYYDGYSLTVCTPDSEGDVVTNKIEYTTEGDLRVETHSNMYVTQGGETVPWAVNDVYKYNSKNQIVYRFFGTRSYGSTLYELTYCESGEVESVVYSIDGAPDSKTVYEYDSRGFIKSETVYAYENGDFTTKALEYKYYCDQKGTVVASKLIKYTDGEITEETFVYYQVIYTSFKTNCYYQEHYAPYFGNYSGYYNNYLLK